jgi:hypothetical protein|tara:strand:+ start:18462 stop:18704 length:243 start_codon:yes stop_codon:yes gene_type:complete
MQSIIITIFDDIFLYTNIYIDIRTIIERINYVYKEISKNMKKLILISLVVIGLGSCSQKLCPTYSHLNTIDSTSSEAIKA